MSMSMSMAKRQKQEEEEENGLIPGLPDHIGQLCLSSVPPTLLFRLCHAWRRLLYSPTFPPFNGLYALLAPPHSPSLHFHAYDPLAATWEALPPPPPEPPLLLRHPAFLSRSLSVQSISLGGRLLLLAATTHNLSPALPRPLLFHPPSRSWSHGPPLSPRRWCALGSLGSSVYVASGIGSHFSLHVARSLHKWDLLAHAAAWEWQPKAQLRDARFSREAVDAVGWRGSLCMVNVKGDAAKEGVVYDVAGDFWKDMPEGMLNGWRGPVAAMEERLMFVVDEAKGALRIYIPQQDAWEDILDNHRLKGAQQLVAHQGKLCVVSPSGISVVDVAVAPPRIFPVKLPEGLEPVAVHVLPRMPLLH